MPIQDSRMHYLFYNATWVEYVLTIGGIAAFLLFFTIASKLVPIIPVSEVVEIEDEIKENKRKIAVEIS